MISVIATARTTTINLKSSVRTFHNTDDYNKNNKNKNVVILLIEKNYHYNTLKSILCIVLAVVRHKNGIGRGKCKTNQCCNYCQIYKKEYVHNIAHTG